LGLCFASAGIIKSLSVAAFTLAWTHSVEKTEWQEDWRVTPQGLQIVEARVKGTGAGMEPPPDAQLVDGWFRWAPQLAVQPEVVLANSGMAGEWRICSGDNKTCQTLSDVFGQPVGTNVTTMRICDAANDSARTDASADAQSKASTPAAAGAPAMDNAKITAEHVVVLLAAARSNYFRGEFSAALDESSEVIRIDPNNAEAFELRGDVWVGIKNYDRAIDNYDAAIKLKPDIARLYSRRAAAFDLMHNFRIAVRDYSDAVRLDPSIATLIDRSEAYKKVRRYDLVIDDLTAALRINPVSADLYHRRGDAFSHNNAYGLAIADFNEAIRLRPEAMFYLDRGNAYQLKGENDLAIADYNKAIVLNDRLALAYNNRGVALRDKGDRPRAFADFTKAAQLDPDLAIAVEHRRELALEVERLGAQMALKKASKTACAAGVKECAR
jgi:tetratricopeptide (TPR) repeat protein